MKKTTKIVLLTLLFFFITTYTPNQSNLDLKKNDDFFKIKNLKITNNFLINESEIKEKLKTIYKKNIFLIKKEDIMKPLDGTNFLKKIEVKKKYPNTVIIKIFETKPLAILFKDKKKYLLDSESNLIFLEENLNYQRLPSIFGMGAQNNFVNFYNKLKNNDFSLKTIKSYYFFQVGRWDLELLNNKIIKFPQNNIGQAIKKSVDLLKRKDFQNYNIIDLRVDGKIIVE